MASMRRARARGRRAPPPNVRCRVSIDALGLGPLGCGAACSRASARASRATPDEVRRPKRPLSGFHDPRGSGDQRMASMRRARARGRRAPPPNVRCRPISRLLAGVSRSNHVRVGPKVAEPDAARASARRAACGAREREGAARCLRMARYRSISKIENIVRRLHDPRGSSNICVVAPNVAGFARASARRAACRARKRVASSRRRARGRRLRMFAVRLHDPRGSADRISACRTQGCGAGCGAARAPRAASECSSSQATSCSARVDCDDGFRDLAVDIQAP